MTRAKYFVCAGAMIIAAVAFTSLGVWLCILGDLPAIIRGDDQSQLAIISAQYGTDEHRIDVPDLLRRGDDQSQLAIISARYGTDEHRIDVPDLLRPLIAHDCLLLRARWDLGNPDPAPNKIKDVQIGYRFNGTQESVTFRQDQDIILPAPTAAFTIVSASFGVDSRRVDVTEAIRACVVDGSLQLPPKWGLGRVDPAAGTVKTVEITYIQNGVPKTATFRQTQELILP